MLKWDFKLFLFLLSLHINIVWAMECEEDPSSHIPPRQVVQEEISDQEQLKAFTHSHNSTSVSSHIKALYVTSDAKFIIADLQRNSSWTRPIITSFDDKYMRLVKEVYVNYPGTPNHLMVCIEAMYFDSVQQVRRIRSFPLKYKESIRDFCSVPPPLPQSLCINLTGDPRAENIVVAPSVQLKKEQEEVKPISPYTQYPILTWIPHQSIDLTSNGYPHTEVDALNAILAVNFRQLVDSIGGKDFLLGMVVKFYSYNDICSFCQISINSFMPQLQSLINEQFGDNNRVIPVIAVGVANHCYGFNSYYCKEEGDCKEIELSYALKNLRSKGSIQHVLKEGTTWESLPQSKYNTREFPLHPPGTYRPFSEAIHIPVLERWPPLYIYIKQPDLKDLQEYLNPGNKGAF